MGLLAAWIVSLAAFSGQPGSMPVADQQAVVAALERDRALLADWRWELETEVRLEGRLEQTQLEHASVDDAGKLRRTPVPDGGDGRTKRPRMSKKLAESVESLRQLADSYACPDPLDMRQALTRAHAWPSSDGTLLRIQSRDVLRRGDSMDLVVERSTRRLLECSILTSFEGEPIRLEVHYVSLENGAFLPQTVNVRTELGERELTLHTRASAAVRR